MLERELGRVMVAVAGVYVGLLAATTVTDSVGN